MRPIERGAVPQVNGQDKTVSDYKNWRADLLDRLGTYCCYCNIIQLERLEVEHVIAQAQGGSILDWNNVVLACGACNSRKNARQCSPTTHFFPDIHNTHLAFTCRIVPHPKQRGKFAAVIVVRGGLNTAQQVKAKNSIELYGLTRIPADRRRIQQAIDLRWKYRYNELIEAGVWRSNWDATPMAGQSMVLDCIRTLARKGGFFSIWFDAFHDVPIVKEALINAFPHTAGCFPAPMFDPIERIPGDL